MVADRLDPGYRDRDRATTNDSDRATTNDHDRTTTNLVKA